MISFEMTPIGWTMRDTLVRRAVLETESGLVVDRGMIPFDSLYRIYIGDEAEIERAVCWNDPVLGQRLYIFRATSAPRDASGESFELHTPSGRETWSFGEAAQRVLDDRLAEWKDRGDDPPSADVPATGTLGP